MRRLITIPISHYCDKARWGLERAGLSYREEAHLQAFHYLASLRFGRSLTVPVLVHDDGVLSASSDILRWVDAHHLGGALYPDALRHEVVRLETQYDTELGPAGRLEMYVHMFPRRDLLLRYGPTGVPSWERRAMPHVLWTVERFIRWRLAIDDASQREAHDHVKRNFDAVAERLADGRPYLLGDAFTAADLTFAAMAAAVVLPPQYGVPLPSLAELPPSFATYVASLRDHPAGAFALRMYRDERPRSAR